MNILMTTWEFPPIKVGGVGSHCYDLCSALSKTGNNITVLSFGSEEKVEAVNDCLTIHRVPSGRAPDTISWSMFLGHRMEKKAAELHKEEKFDIVHAHDWMMVPAGIGIKKLLDIPMVFTLHSTESGRVGIHDSYTRMINDLEWYGTYEASQVITVGREFYNEVKGMFGVPEHKINYIPNGVDIERFDNSIKSLDRSDFALEWEKIVLFVGRLTYQKGVEHMINAMPSIISEHKEAKFVMVGNGAVDYYRSIAFRNGVGSKVLFTRFVPEETLISLYKAADMTVVPSIYEPFGIVALEAAASRTACIGSYVGGLKENIIHNVTGLHTYPADQKSISAQINSALSDSSWCKSLGRNGRRFVEKNFKWRGISNETQRIYEKAITG